MIRKKIALVTVIFATCFAVCVYLFTRSDHNSAFIFLCAPKKVDTASAYLEKDSKGSRPRSRNTLNNASNEVDPELLRSTESLLKRSELKRFKFDRKLENDKRVLFEFLIEAPTGDDLIEVNRNISKVKGMTTDSNAKPIEWRQLLAEQYSNSLGFRYQVVTVTFPKDSTSPHYSVLGVRDGNLKTRDGGGAFPIDGKMNVLAFEVTFDPNSVWRYSHLFEEE